MTVSKGATNVVTLDRIYFAEQFGVVADDSTDNAVTLQTAVTAAKTAGRKLVLPSGTIRSSVAINITGPLQIEGQGRDITICKLMNATMNFFNVTSDSACFFRDMTFTAGQVQSGGAAIRVNGATNGVTENPKSRFSNLTFQSLYQAINFVASNTWTIDGIRVTGTVDAGVVINNSVNGDSGDNVITNSYFSSGVGIRHNGSGGLKIIGNKFNVCTVGYDCDWTNANGSTQITLVGNQFDLCTTNCVLFERSSGASTIASVVMAANRFSISGAVKAVWFKTNNATYVTSVNLGGNYYDIGASGTGIQIDGGTLINISGEIIQGNAGTSVGIATGNSTAQSISIGPVQFFSCTTKQSITSSGQLVDATFANVSATTYGVATATSYTTATSTVPVPNNTATTIFTFSAFAASLGIYQVEVDLEQGLNSYASWAQVSVGAAGITLANVANGTVSTLSASGLNLQMTQTSGVSQTMRVRVVRFGL